MPSKTNLTHSLAGMQVASVMGLSSVALDLLLLIHPMSTAQAEDQVLSSSRQDMKNDMQELESAGFLKPCKDTPDSWEFAQVFLLCLSALCFPASNPLLKGVSPLRPPPFTHDHPPSPHTHFLPARHHAFLTS